MFDIIGKRFRFFIISGIVILICIISLFSFGLKSGIEFSGGSQLTLSFNENVELTELKQELDNLGYGNAIVQKALGSGDFIIRAVSQLPNQIGLSDSEETQLINDLAARFGPLDSRSDDISPITAKETKNITTIAVAIAAVGIMLYVTWAFRRMPKPFRYGTCAIIALLHDALVALGVFSILGGILGWEINLMFITGILAVIGYSVNDTVIIFDRIRENVLKNTAADFKTVVNSSLVESLTRSINTSFTTLIVVLALLFFVGSTIQNFAVVLLIGIITGTYSSIFIASALLVVWEKREWHRFFQWLPFLRTNTGE